MHKCTKLVLSLLIFIFYIPSSILSISGVGECVPVSAADGRARASQELLHDRCVLTVNYCVCSCTLYLSVF